MLLITGSLGMALGALGALGVALSSVTQLPALVPETKGKTLEDMTHFWREHK